MRLMFIPFVGWRYYAVSCHRFLACLYISISGVAFGWFESSTAEVDACARGAGVEHVPVECAATRDDLDTPRPTGGRFRPHRRGCDVSWREQGSEGGKCEDEEELGSHDIEMRWVYGKTLGAFSIENGRYVRYSMYVISARKCGTRYMIGSNDRMNQI